VRPGKVPASGRIDEVDQPIGAKQSGGLDCIVDLEAAFCELC
jgi:hypothetical protein